MSEFSNQEIKILEQMRKKDYGYSKIAKELDKTFVEVKNKCIQQEFLSTDSEEISKKLKGKY